MMRTSLSRRLLLSAFLLCTLLVLLVTAVELNMHRIRQKQLVRAEISNFKQGTRQAIREAVWLFDWAMVKTIVESQTSQLIGYIEICDRQAQKCIQSGVENNAPYIEEVLLLRHQVRGEPEPQQIGTVRLQGHYDPFWRHVQTDGPDFLLTNALSIYGIALLIFLLFHRQLIRRLVGMEQFTRQIDLQHVEAVGQLPYRRRKQRPDEVDRLADAIDGLVDKVKDEFERRRQLEQQLLQTQKMEALGTLAGGIAHDFNNILAAILGYAQLSLRQSEPGSKEQRRLEQIVQAGKRAKELIAQILVFSRRHEAERELLRLAGVAEEALGLVRASLPPSIRITTELDAELQVLGDATGLHQVVMNLAVNAGHAVQASGGGQIRVRLERRQVDEQTRGVTLAPGSYVCLEISDDGPGIPAEIQRRIFEPFFTTKAAGEGTGMGLAVVHGIIQSHGGGIDLQSRAGQGTTFSVYLPEASGAQQADEVREAVPLGQGEQLLLVDDEVAVAAVGAETLESLGYRVSVCNDPEAALQRLRQQRVDLLISDLVMPQFSGAELVRRAKQIDPQLTVLLWSGNAESLDEEALRSGLVDRLLLKPYTIETLAQTIRQLLTHKGDSERADTEQEATG